MNIKTLQVVKVGGSLFQDPAFPARLIRWLTEQPLGIQLLVPGGGALADEVRRWDKLFGLPPQLAHWACIDLLAVIAKMLTSMLPPAELIRDLQELSQRDNGTDKHGLYVLDPITFLRSQEPNCAGNKLPEDWTVTSDSIAARVAVVLKASELVLLKSADPPRHANVEQLSQSGFVDECFPTISGELTCWRIVNLP